MKIREIRGCLVVMRMAFGTSLCVIPWQDMSIALTAWGSALPVLWRHLQKAAAHRFLPIAWLAVVPAVALCSGAQAQGDALRRGLSLMHASQPAQAEQVLGAISAGDRDYIRAQTLLGCLFFQRSALPAAERAFRNVLGLQAGNAEARLGLGMALLRRGAATEAATVLHEVPESSPLGIRARIAWVHSLFLSGRTDDALLEAQRLTARHHSVAELHNLLGFLHQIRSAAGEALREYLVAAELDPGEVSTCFHLISAYRLAGDWEKALGWARRALVLDPGHPLLYQELAEICEHLGMTAEAGRARSMAEQTYDAEILYAKAMRSAWEGRGREAEKLLRESAGKNPKLARAWIDLGDLLRQETRPEEARDAYLRALEASPGESRAVLGLAEALRTEGREEEAFRFCLEAVQGGAASPDVLTALAAMYQDQGRAQDAETAVIQAIRQLPDHPDLLSYLGYLRLSAGRPDEALESYGAALRLNPLQTDALVGQAQAQLLQGNARGALTSLSLARSLDPKNTAILKRLAEAHRKAGDPKASESSCRQCMAIDPEDLECREQLAALRLEASDFREAVSHYRFILQKAPAAKSVLDGLAFALMQLGDYDRAIEAAGKSVREFGPDLGLYSTLGTLYRYRGNLREAIRYYRLARDLAAADPERNFDLGLALYLAREYAAASVTLQTALRLKPDWGIAHYYLALTYWNQGQRVLALAHARRALQQGVQAAGQVVQALSASLSFAGTGGAHIRR